MQNIISILVVLSILISDYCGAASIGGWMMGGNIGESNVTLTYQTSLINQNGKFQFNGLYGYVNPTFGDKNNVSNNGISFYVGNGSNVYNPNGSLENTLLADIDICVKGNNFKICGKLDNNERQLTSIVTTGNPPPNGSLATVEINISNIHLKMPFNFDKLTLGSSVFISFRDANNMMLTLRQKTVSTEIKASQASYGATLTASSIIKLTANGSASEYATLNCTEHPAKVTLNTSIAKNRLLIDGTPMKEYSMICTTPKMHRLAVEPLRTAPIGKTTEMINMTLIYP